MRIKKIDGTFIETDEYNDLSAQLYEKSSEFCKWCAENKVPILCKFIDVNRKKVSGFQNFNQNNQEQFAIIINAFILEIEQMLNAKIEINFNDAAEEWKS